MNNRILPNLIQFINFFLQIFVDGSPHAQIPLPGEVQQVNGTFHPIATPVISGRRAYILTQFIPEGSKVPHIFKSLKEF